MYCLWSETPCKDKNLKQMNCIKVIISGRVQGVGFRYYTKRKADSLGLFGWVKNLPDNTVETYVIGTDKEIEEFIEFCKIGPSSAHVANIKIVEDNIDRSLNSFSIIH